MFLQKLFLPHSLYFDKMFSFVKRISFSFHRCPEWQISLAEFAKAIRQEKTQSLLKDADQIIPLLFSKAFGQANSFYWKCDYTTSSYKLLLAKILCSEEVLAEKYHAPPFW